MPATTNIQKFHNEVKARLKAIGDPRRAAAFAFRMALLALPRLDVRGGEEDEVETQAFLWFWKEEEREKHLLALCRAQQLGFCLPENYELIISLFGDYIDAAHVARASDDAFDAANAAFAAAADAALAAAFAYDAARVAAYVAAFAADADLAADATLVAAYTYDAARTADTAAYAATYATAYDADIEPLVAFVRQELKQLATARDAAAYLAHPAPLPFPERHRQFLVHLRQVPTFSYWADWFQARIDGEPWDREVMKKSVRLPEEVAAQGPQAVNPYLADIAAGRRQEKIKRVRAIFIGNGDAGKTSLIRALNGQPVTEGGTDETCGIDISEWQVPGTDLTAHFWDFGGQVIAHATHQFFLRERCVYVLLLNARSTDANPNQQAEYWLEFVRAFGNDAPVLLVGNKCDLAPVQVDVHRLRESYPNLRGAVHGLACTQYAGGFAREFGIFRDAFVAELARAGEAAHFYFSPEEFRMIEALREASGRAAFLEKSAFDGICDDYGIGKEKRHGYFLNLLDQLGEVIHFPALYKAGFREFLLNPRWLTQGVYQLLYSGLLQRQHGLLRERDIRELLADKSIPDAQGRPLDYPDDKIDFLIRAMAAFKLCYPFSSGAPDEEDAWIVPDLLPSDQPTGLVFHKRGALRFDFAFSTFLPRHVLNSLMVSHYEDIRAGQAWQHGVRLASRHAFPGAEALIRADYQSRVLKVAVAGKNVEGYFYALYHSILTILHRMPRLQYTKRLHLPPEACKGEAPGRLLRDEEAAVDFEEVLAQRAKGLPEFTCKFGDYDWERLLRSLPPEVMAQGMSRDRVVLETERAKADGGTAGAAWWEKGMIVFGGLGGLAALIGGGGILGWFGRLSPSGGPSLIDRLLPFLNSWEIPLVVVGVAMMIGALGVWRWRRQKKQA